jgi:hypothetical protein
MILSTASLDARNLTVSGNGEHGVFCSNGSLEVTSSIVDHNGAFGFFGQNASADLRFNDAWQNGSGGYSGLAAGMGSIAADPAYVSFVNRDFHLLEGSPCIDTGSPTDPQDPDGTRTDMGALFYNQNPVRPGGEDPLPAAYRIVSAWPNPFNPVLHLEVAAAHPAWAVLEAWSADGRRAARIWEGRLEAGLNPIAWDASQHPSGTYYLRLLAGGAMQILPCTLIK